MSLADKALVFTDLDGSLLDHNTYSYHDARPQLYALERLGIPLIPASSKTRVEIEQLRRELGNTEPFISENGAAVFIPVGYFDGQPEETVVRDGYWVHEMSPPRARWLEMLAGLSGQFPQEFDYFYSVGPEGIARLTSMSLAQAEQANQREYSEPVHWRGSPERRMEFITAVEDCGAAVLQGGRFLSVAGQCDKGRALRWLRQQFQRAHPGQAWHYLAIGDSGNDCAMLDAAETALLVRSPVHGFPPLQRTSGIIRSESYGPEGWAEGVALWLETYRLHG